MTSLRAQRDAKDEAAARLADVGKTGLVLATDALRIRGAEISAQAEAMLKPTAPARAKRVG